MRIALACAMLLAASSVTRASTFSMGESDFGLAGGSRVLWIYQYGSDGIAGVASENDLNRRIRFAFRSSGAFAGMPMALNMEDAAGTIALHAVVGHDLHIFFSDGTHRRMSKSLADNGLPHSVADTIDLSLPDYALPVAIVGDEAKSLLYALVTTSQANVVASYLEDGVDLQTPADDLQDEIDEPDNLLGDQEEEKDFDGSEDAIGYLEIPDAVLSLVRLEEGKWHRDRDFPVSLEGGERIFGLWANDGVIDVVYRDEPEGSPWRHLRSRGAAEPWEELGELPADSYDLLAGGWYQSFPALMIGQRGRTVTSISLMKFVEDQWEIDPPLSSHAGMSQGIPGEASFGVYDDKLAAVFLDDVAVARIATWSLGDRSPLGEIGPVGLFIPSQISPTAIWLRDVFNYAVFSAAVIVLFLWRRENLATPIKLRPGLAIPLTGARLLAALIDAIILLPAWVPLVMFLLSLESTGMNFYDQMAMAGRVEFPVRFWFSPAAGVIWAVYGTIFEVFFGTTPGKRIMGCYVTDQDGDRCDSWRIVVRNIMRIPEYSFPPVLLLVIVTVNSQRLGDVISQTLVLRSVPIEDSASELEAEESQDE